MIPLPDEIYLYIIKSLPDLAAFTHKKEFEDYRQISTTLASACQVSRVFRAFAQPLLYRAYIEDEEDLNRHSSSEADDYTRLQLFLQTLIQRPDLAAKVKYLRLADCLERPNIKPYCPLGGLFIKASRTICAFYKRLPLGKARLHRDSVWQSDWQHGLRINGTYDAEVALLLSLLPNLSSLDMYAAERNIGRFVSLLCHGVVDAQSWTEEMQIEDGEPIKVFKVAQASHTLEPPFLNRLSSFTFIASKENQIFDIDFLKDVACLSRLESLCIDRGFDPYREVTVFRLPLQHIRNLTLKECTMLDIHLRSLVKSCGSLRSLHITLSEYSSQPGIDLDALLKCLTSSFETLEELQLCLPNTFLSRHVSVTQDEPFDLRSFTRLKMIEISMECLVAPTSDMEPSFLALLPSSVDDLYLRMADKRFANHLRALAEEYKGLPNLKTVDIGIDDMPSIHAMDEAEVDWKLALNDCVRTLRDGGIECNVPVEGAHFNLSCGDD